MIKKFKSLTSFFLFKEKKWLYSFFFVLVIFSSFFLFAHPAQAGLDNIVARVLSWVLMPIISFLGRLLILLIDILIGVAQYNDFIHATAVVKGWIIIRDLCNMFFILILLLIAFATVLGIEKYNYKRLLVKVLVAAVLINFSRMICGLIIDFAQVIMMTFVNAFKDAAAGNLTTGLGLKEMLELNKQSPPEDIVNPFEIVIAMLLAIVLLMIALVVVSVIVLLLIIRIVYLWILIVLSPFAFLASALPGGIGRYGSTWWNKFTTQVIIGPVLAFFFWLALSVIAASPEGIYKSQFEARGALLPTSINTEVPGGIAGGAGEFAGGTLAATISSIGQSDRILSFGICIAMLVASLLSAQTLGAAGGGIAGRTVGKMQAVGAMPFKRAAARAKGFYQRELKGGGKMLWGKLAEKKPGIMRVLAGSEKQRLRWVAKGERAKQEKIKAHGEYYGVEDMNISQLKKFQKTGGISAAMASKMLLDKGEIKRSDEAKAAARNFRKYGFEDEMHKLEVERPQDVIDTSTRQGKVKLYRRVEEGIRQGKKYDDPSFYQGKNGALVADAIARALGPKKFASNFKEFDKQTKKAIISALKNAIIESPERNDFDPNTFAGQRNFRRRKSLALMDPENIVKYYKKWDLTGNPLPRDQIGVPEEINNYRAQDLVKTIKPLSGEDLVKLKKEDLKLIAPYLSTGQLKGIVEAGASADQIKAIKDGITERYNQYQQELQAIKNAINTGQLSPQDPQAQVYLNQPDKYKKLKYYITHNTAFRY